MDANQLGRRNLTPMERAELALELEAEVRAGARERQAHGMTAPGKTLTQNSAEPLPSGESRQAIARIAGVSHDTIAKVRYVTITKRGWRCSRHRRLRSDATGAG